MKDRARRFTPRNQRCIEGNVADDGVRLRLPHPLEIDDVASQSGLVDQVAKRLEGERIEGLDAAVVGAERADASDQHAPRVGVVGEAGRRVGTGQDDRLRTRRQRIDVDQRVGLCIDDGHQARIAGDEADEAL